MALHLAVSVIYLQCNSQSDFRSRFAGLPNWLTLAYLMCLVWSLKRPTDLDAIHLSVILQAIFCLIYAFGLALMLKRHWSTCELAICIVALIVQIILCLLLLKLTQDRRLAAGSMVDESTSTKNEHNEQDEFVVSAKL